MLKRDLRLTESTCNILDEIRLIFEVKFGVQVRIKNIHFNKGYLASGEGTMFLSGTPSYFERYEEKKFLFTQDGEYGYDVAIEDEWHTVKFDLLGTVRVISGNSTTWTVGSSPTARSFEPLFPERQVQS